MTWARIPHFYSTPYYVYQYATCFASSAQLMKQLIGRDPEREQAAPIDRYLTLLKSGGSDHPMALLQRAGVDLSRPETVRAVVDQLDTLSRGSRRTQLDTRESQNRQGSLRLRQIEKHFRPRCP